MTVPQLAQRLGVSRITIHNRVVQGRIKADRVGRNHIVSAHTVGKLVGDRNARIAAGVRKVVSQYGSVLERLGKE